MSQILSGFQWWNSPAHLLLLSKFLVPRPVTDLLYSGGWEQALGEPPQQALDRFIQEKLLVHADLAERVAQKYDVADVQTMVERRGLLAAGDKDDMIAALIRNDRHGMQAAVEGIVVLRCTETGRDIAEEYLARQAEQRHEAEERVRTLLQNRQFKQAARAVVRFESQRVFPGGFELGISPGAFWQYHDATRDAMILRRIFSRQIPELEALDDTECEQFAIAISLMYLWGTETIDRWLSNDFDVQMPASRDYSAIAHNLLARVLEHIAPDAMIQVTGEASPLTRTRIVEHIAAARVDKTTPKLRNLDLRGLDLSGLNLNGTDLRSSNLCSADLRGAHLVGADLAHAKFRKASLRFADLSDANLFATDLRDADLYGAELGGTNLDDAKLTGATLPTNQL